MVLGPIKKKLVGANQPHLVTALCSSFSRENGHAHLGSRHARRFKSYIYLLKMVAKTPNPTIRDLFPKWVETWWASRNPGTGAGCPKAMKKNFGATKLFNYHTACILQNLLLYTINPRQGYGAPLWAVHLVQLIRDHLSVWVASSFVRPQNE